MTSDPADLRLLGALAALVHRVHPVPRNAMADAEAAGLRLGRQEPRLPTRDMDVAWLLPS
jgi:hypothetical protein